ncbi:MAG: cyanoexosortase A [Cyanobacteriota bacterium]|nr:cyanoexosortase A [Cyanobacteriota bacterium]
MKTLTESRFWLLGVAVGLMAIHLTLTIHRGSPDLQAISFFFWFAASSLVWQKRDRLNLTSGIFPTLLGLIVIAAVLLKSSTSATSNFLGVSPFISGVGLTLLASGFRGFRYYWQELLILFFLGVPKVLLWPVIDISGLTARFTTFILWYSGFKVYRLGFNIVMPGGAVNVNMGCSGLSGMFYLLGFAVLFLILFPLQKLQKKILVLISSLAIAFVVNGIRVAVMAFFANIQDKVSLDYWHVGDGSLIFMMISVVLFGSLYWFLLNQEEPEGAGSSNL